MTIITVAPAAQVDFQDNYAYGETRYGERAAVAYAAALMDAVRSRLDEKLLAELGIGALLGDNTAGQIGDGIFVARYKAHFVVYRHTHAGAEIIGLIGARQDTATAIQRVIKRLQSAGDDNRPA